MTWNTFDCPVKVIFYRDTGISGPQFANLSVEIRHMLFNLEWSATAMRGPYDWSLERLMPGLQIDMDELDFLELASGLQHT